ncbi:MAG: HAMP domain-containing sensor histidine kinase [Candidatus Berkelbacteria bacterium]|nr:HAMP domain-containing sensor histidine kinase [Candidatus Berkelbacteria bacterium]
MKFTAAITKLTVFYVLIVMFISIGFSVAIFQISSNEIDRGLNRQNIMLQNLPPRNDSHLLDDFANLRVQQLNDSNNHLRTNLIYFNLLILILSTFASYFFARWTLRPLEEAIEEQNRFTADASHELKTPLAAMRSEIEVSLRDKSSSLAESKRLLNSNLEEIEKLETLSGALLKLAKLDETNKLEFEALNLDEIIVEAYEKVEGLAKKKSIDIDAKLVSARILGDKPSLTELFVILLDNAIKYSPSGSKIKVKLTSDGKHSEASIKDHGVGIKSSELPHIFDRFYRADQSRNKEKAEGYGLGLSIAKRIVDLHSGKILAISIPGKGTEFIVKF